MSLPSLPIDEVLGELVDTLREQRAVLLEAPTGAGKTTRVPGALLDAGIAQLGCAEGGGEVIVLEPRRIAARAAARRTAQERGVSVGAEVGYQVRFDSKRSKATRITFVTEGLFLRRLQGDPFLEGVGLVIFDEFHERNLDGDLSLALVRRVQLEARDDLRLLVMSATLDTAPLLEFLDSPPMVSSRGRSYPVEIEYLSPAERPERGRPDSECLRRGVRQALTRSSGDVLVFLPGVGEIRRLHSLLQEELKRQGILLFELYGDQSPEEQDRALAVHGQRAVHLATNVAETSLTLPGITAVVDSGLARKLRHDPARGLNRLELQAISRASAQQRSGRAGRTAPGYCLRLWTEHDERSRRDEEEPEVSRVDITGALLELFLWGEPDGASFPWFEAPSLQSLESSRVLLERLGAIQVDSTGAARLTDLGRRIAGLPLHPRLARLLIDGAEGGALTEAATCAALLSERSPFRRDREFVHSLHSGIDSDLIDRMQAILEFEDGARSPALNPGVTRGLLRVRDQLVRSLGADRSELGGEARDLVVARSLLHAFPDRLAKRRAPGDPRAVMSGGRGVRLARESTVSDAELFLCLELADIGQDSLVRSASEIRSEWLDGDLLRTEVALRFDNGTERVVAEQLTRFGDLTLDARPATLTRDGKSAAVLAQAAGLDLPRALKLEDPEFKNLVARLSCLGEWMPELELAPVDDERLRGLLPGLCSGKLSFAELRKANLGEALRRDYDWKQLEALDRQAPERIAVPSGNRIRLSYEAGRPPVLAARIQELFGWRKVPRVGGGRISILLHLLAPNMRPQQVTDDLESFWNSTYPTVRKELRRRYPKHDWPEDPWQAKAKRRPGR